MEKVKKHELLRFGDALAILLVIALASGVLWAFFAKEQGSVAEIVIDGEAVAALPLSGDTVYPVKSNGYTLTVCVENGEAFVTDADCPDKVCEHTGRIKARGASIVCAAAKVSVRIVGGGDQNADFVAG